MKWIKLPSGTFVNLEQIPVFDYDLGQIRWGGENVINLADKDCESLKECLNLMTKARNIFE